MDLDSIGQLTRILQLSITPVALISGVGLLLLSMTNRLGRVIDRARVLGEADEEVRAAGREEVRVLVRRARLLLGAIALIAFSIFLAVLMVAALFAMYLLAARLERLVLLLFGGCLACLVASTACFLGDILLSIRWLRLSLGRWV
jgi:hypothetical protein